MVRYNFARGFDIKIFLEVALMAKKLTTLVLADW